MKKVARRRWLGLIIGLLLFLSFLPLAGCSSATETSSEGKLVIMVSVVPQVYFVERVGGEHVSAQAMVLPGSNPATYEPKPEQLKDLSRADAYMSIGVPFEEAWLERISAANPDLEMVDTAEGIERRSIAGHEHEGEEHGETESPDPHIWLSPRLVKVQARKIADALIELDPEHRDDYEKNLAAFISDINELDRYIAQRLDDLPRRRFMVFHPSWGYFANDYGLEMIPIEIEGQEPSPQELARLIDRAQDEDIRVIFAQPEFSTRQAETIADEIGGEVRLIDPLAAGWLENMYDVADTFADVLSQDYS